MNPLAIFGFVILGFVILGLALLAAMFAPLGWGIGILVDHETGTPFPALRIAIAVTAFAVALAATIWIVGTLLPISNGSEHCGPGTHYLETGSGKNRSWVCVAS